ncbi:MAG: KpsF/GutQ family sugar-phosphate isomerase [Candidatus Hydrogenedentota bacterium]|nr:MAG: KpsF/GutQ family sugar-phosphate isomerase [Candidatus Hydrogenedentota bacterium]
MLEDARDVFDTEIEGLTSVRDSLGNSFIKACETILECRGKIIVTGLGKSGAVGRKIAATLSSTGTPAVFLHAGEGLHGDLGVIAPGDVVLAISYSGDTEELALLLPAVRRLGVPLLAMTGEPDSTLGRAAQTVLSTKVPREACPLGLAPTSSTTAALVLGDALAVAVYRRRGFTREDFAFRHPAGALGRSLLRVRDLMHTEKEIPRVLKETPLREVILEMSRKRLGMTTVVDSNGRLAGIITDGDLRRLLEKNNTLDVQTPAFSVVGSTKPRTIAPDQLAVQALTVMENHKITSLIIVDGQRRPVGVIHIHDILRSKVV